MFSQPLAAPLPDLGGHVLRALVVLAELVWQPGVRVGAHRHLRYARELLDVLPQFLRAQSAVEP